VGLGLDQQRRKAKNAEPSVWNKAADALTIPTKPYADMTFGMGKEGYPGGVHDPVCRKDVLQVAVGQDRPVLPPADGM